MRKIIVFLVTIVIVLIILCNYKTEKTVVDPSAGTLAESDKVEFVSVNITYDDSLDKKVLSEVQDAISKFPPEVIKSFAENHWKIGVVKDINLDGTPFEGETTPRTVGMTNFKDKTIQVSPISDGPDNFVMIKAMHEMSHYADEYYDNAADKSDWKALYEAYKNSYVEYEFKGITPTADSRADIAYATSDRWEMFACCMKDYLNNPEYLRLYYPELFEYMRNLMYSSEN